MLVLDLIAATPAGRQASEAVQQALKQVDALCANLRPWQIIVGAVVGHQALVWVAGEAYTVWMGEQDAIHRRIARNTFALVRKIPYVRERVDKEVASALVALSSGSMMKIPASKTALTTLPPHPIDKKAISAQIDTMAELSRLDLRMKEFKVCVSPQHHPALP